VLGLIPNDLGVTLLTPADAPQVYNAIDLLKSIWLWMGLVAVGTLAGALGVSRHRRGTLRAWSVTTLVLGLLMLVTLRIARGRVLVAAKPDNRDAVGAVYDVLAGSLRSWTIWLVVFTVVVLVLTLTWGRLGVVAGVRRGMRSARDQVQRRREAHATAATTGADGVARPAAEESWGRRVAANTRAFADGLGLSDRATDLGVFVRAHLGPARWTGISVGAVVLLFWPGPTLRVLIWIVAFVALYLGALEWLLNRAPEGAAGSTRGEVEAPAYPPIPVGGNGSSPTAAASVPRPSVAPLTGQPVEVVPAPREALTPELMSSMNDRLGLLVRLGAARDAGVLTDEEFHQEKERLLAL
jgi:hypothetical protein